MKAIMTRELKERMSNKTAVKIEKGIEVQNRIERTAFFY